MMKVLHLSSGVGLHALHKRVYRFRALGMGLGLLPVAVVLHELQSPWPAWAWALFCCLLWPHLAYVLAERSRDPLQAEIRNLLVDSAIAGSLVPVMHFNLLPSVLLMTVTTADKVASGLRGLWRRSLPGMALTLFASALLNRFAVDYPTSTAVLVASLPILVIHTLAVSANGYRLIRKVQKQNQRLDELTRTDTLTGLQSRAHWQEQAASLLAGYSPGEHPASLMLLDVDLFKEINDRHGHTTGDDVLCRIAEAIRAALPEGSHAGRLGGDEFAVAMPVAPVRAHEVGEAIRRAVESLAFREQPTLHCSVSIGIAEPPARADLRAWLIAADHALYQAKAAGRNRVSRPLAQSPTGD